MLSASDRWLVCGGCKTRQEKQGVVLWIGSRVGFLTCFIDNVALQIDVVLDGSFYPQRVRFSDVRRCSSWERNANLLLLSRRCVPARYNPHV